MIPTWWNERRLGVLIHTSLASVPAWAPIGEYAEWYRSHLGEPVADVAPHRSPMPEVLAHHRDRWGHVATYDDFAELLTFDRFDPEEWAELVAAAGAGYSVFTAKHHDGWAWWDAPGSTKRLTDTGPRRNVLSEYAAACERHDLVVGTYLSLLDWGDDRYPGAGYVADALHPQAVDLVDRYGSAYLWGDGHWGHDASTWRTEELVDRLRALNPELLLNDRWCARIDEDGHPPVVHTFEHDLPGEILDGPWELTRGIGPSFGRNRADEERPLLDGRDIIAVYTEVLAKNGNLLLNVGPAADGSVPEFQAEPLRAAGRWIAQHEDLLADATPWDDWGDRDARYLRQGELLIAIDVSGLGTFRSLHHGRPVQALRRHGDETPVRWGQRADGLHIERRHSSNEPGAYLVDLGPEVERISLFDLPDPTPIDLSALVADAASGDIVQLGDGVYAGPVVVPPGVILRGLGRDRTTIVAAPGATIAPAPAAVTLGRHSRIEHLTIETPRDTPTARDRPLLRVDDAFATILGCEVRGSVEVAADDAVVRATTARQISIVAADRALLSRCSLRGDRWDVGVDVRGGNDHEIESCSLTAHLNAIRLSDAVSPIVRGCRIEARWVAIHAQRTERAHLHGNQIRSTMRAVEIDSGNAAVVEGNAVHGGDSGCLVHAGATAVIVRGNHWSGTRAGLITWNADPWHGDNVCVDLGDADAALISGPEVPGDAGRS